MVEQRPCALADAQPIIDRWAKVPGGLLPMLNDLQETFGYIDDGAVPAIAEALNISRAEVVGVIHFYHDFRHEPPARHSLKICLAEACQAKGSDAVVEALKASIGIGPGETTNDGAFALDPVYCLGNCGLSPALTLDGRLYGRVTPERAAQLVGTAP